jgi:periplasmic protein CpxP/Spy
MKLKLIPIITGAVLLATAAPFAIKVMAAPGQQLAQATTQPANQQRTGRQNQLNLTSEQKDQMRQLHQETRQKIEDLLSSDQLTKYKAAMQSRRGGMRDQAGEMNSASAQGNGNRRQNIFTSLNLSQDQQAKIREIMQSSRTRMSSILTDSQRDQMQQMMRNRKNQAQ